MLIESFRVLPRGPCSLPRTHVSKGPAAPWPRAPLVQRARRAFVRGAAAAEQGCSDPAGLAKWAERSGVQAPLLRLADFSGLRGMAASRDIEVDEPLASLPKDAALLVVPKMPCPFPELCSPELWDSSPWWFKMALLLLDERNKGETSRLSGYVEQLPKTLDTPLHWSDAELADLQYPPLVASVHKQRDDWADIHSRLASSTPGTPVTREDLYWAIENVRSRAFSGPYTGGSASDRIKLGLLLLVLAAAGVGAGKVIIEDALNGLIAAFGFNLLYDLLLSQRLKWFAMCPFIDFMNHRSTVESDVSWEYFSGRFVARAMKPWEAGEQVFINYGAQSNDSLLQYYGFVEADNPNDAYVVNDFGSLISECSQSDKGAELFRRANIVQQLEEVKIPREGIPAVAVVAARLLTMPEHLIKSKGLEAANAELPAKDEAAAMRLVHSACTKLLDRSRTSLQEDLKLLKRLERDEVSPRATLAARFRVEKKRLLEDQCKRLAKKAEKLEGSLGKR